LIRKILDLLDPHNGLSNADILRKTGVDLESNERLRRELLARTDFVREKEGLYYYVTKHHIKDKQELFDLLVRNPEGLPWSELKLSYKGIEVDYQELQNSGKVFTITNIENREPILFALLDHFKIELFPEFKNLWSSVKIPDDVDLEKEMEQAGLKMIEQEKRNKRPAPKTKRKQINRKVKLTNTHLEDIDLTKDFVIPPKEGTGNK